MSIPIVAVCALLLAGILALLLALRGSRINNHPHCRGCRFDLSGLAPDQSSLRAMRCPECGSELSTPRALRHGARRRKPLFVVLASLLLIATFGFTGVYTWGRASKFNWNTIKPVWMLMLEARRGGPGSELEAVKELARRAAGDGLHDGALNEAAAMAFEVHASEARPWLFEYGDLIEHAWRRGMLSDAQKEAYAHQVARVALGVRARNGFGKSVPISLAFQAGKASNGGIMDVEVDAFAARLAVDGTPLDLTGVSRLNATYTAVNHGGGTSSTSNTFYLKAAPGSRTIEATLHFAAYLHGTTGMMNSEIPPHTDKPLFEWTETRTAATEILPPSASDVEWITDKSLGAAVRGALSVADVRVTTRSGDPADTDSQRIAQMTVHVKNSPVALAYDVLWRSGTEEWSLGQVQSAANGGDIRWGVGNIIEHFDANVIDVVLRPSESAARNSMNTFKFWGGEIVIRNVAVQRLDKPAPSSPGAQP